MKIALIDPSLFTWPYDNALAKGLAENGHHVTLYAKYLSPGEQGQDDPFLRQFFYPGFQTKLAKNLPHKLFLGLKGVAHIFSMAALFITLLFKKPDAIHFQWTPLAVVDQFFIPLFRLIAPTVLTVHDSSPFNNNPSAALQRIGAIRIMNKFDHLIVHTEQAEKALKKHGIAPGKIVQIPHGVLVSGKAARNTQDGLVHLLLFGQVKPYKGTDILIRALGRLPAPVLAQCRLHVTGKPQMDMAPLFALAESENVRGAIDWDLRFVDEEEIPGIFSNADALIMPYREIDASGVMMLAFSTGLPIIASRIGLFAELLEDGKHGFLTPQEDADALAKALEKLIGDPALRAEFSANIKKLGGSIPSWKDIGARTAALYTSV